MGKISSQPQDTAPTTDDYTIGVDASSTSNRRWTLASIRSLFLTQPTITDFTNAQHDHGDADDGGALAAGSVLPQNLVTGTGTTWVWQDWTSTLTNLTLGNGTVTTKHIKIGKTVFYKFTFTLGSTSAVGTGPQFTLPSTPRSIGGSGSGSFVAGVVHYEDNGVQSFDGYVYVAAATPTSTASLVVGNVAGTYLSASQPTATVPFAFGTGDEIRASGWYEEA